MRDFVGGLELGGRFYGEIVGPLLELEFPEMAYSAALIGPGSEVLGFDTSRSTDHGWGPRLLLFLSEKDYEFYTYKITETLRYRLPREYGGYSTHFGEPDAEGVRISEKKDSGPVDHGVTVHTVHGFFASWTGIDLRASLAPEDWLHVPQQRLLEVTAGRVYHDGLDELLRARERLAYYPKDVWLYMLATQWRRVGQLEAFVGRTGEVGDELGSRLICASIVRELMGLCFLMERKYVPYPKWLGTAFSRLRCSPVLRPWLDNALAANSWKVRERNLSAAYEFVATMHNALGLTPSLGGEVSFFHDRPYLVPHAERFAVALEELIEDPRVRALPCGVGSADQITDSTDVLSNIPGPTTSQNSRCFPVSSDQKNRPNSPSD